MCLLPAAGLLAPGCNDPSAHRMPEQRVFASSEEFDKGRADGVRDAKWSLFDESGAWMWLWMADQNYANGYRHGWREGRAEVQFRKEQEQARKDMGHPEKVESIGKEE